MGKGSVPTCSVLARCKYMCIYLPAISCVLSIALSIAGHAMNVPGLLLSPDLGSSFFFLYLSDMQVRQVVSKGLPVERIHQAVLWVPPICCVVDQVVLQFPLICSTASVE